MRFRKSASKEALRKPVEAIAKDHFSPATVLVTGSTGTIGPYLVHNLLQQPQKIRKVICFSRSEDAKTRQALAHKERGLQGVDSVDFVAGDLSEQSLGLGVELYQSLLQRVTHVLHASWAVDFNRHFSSFEPQIQGVVNLIEFATSCKAKCRLFFLSSISVVANWNKVPGSRKRVPEIVLEDWRVAGMGYGQSKIVAERLLAEATSRSGPSALERKPEIAICRVGQVAGPVLKGTQGEWNRREWLPSLIASSKHLEKLPATLGPVNRVEWLPVDILAEMTIELLLSPYADQPEVFHLVNPDPTCWESLLPIIQKYIGAEVVTFNDWVTILRDSAEATDIEELSARNPATKLLPFFNELQDKARRFPDSEAALFDVQNTQKHSMRMRAVDGSKYSSWMETWLQQWSFGG